VRGLIAGAVAAVAVSATLALGGGATFIGGACAAGAAGACSTPSFPSGSAGSANLWVDTTGGTCSRNASPATYNAATSCGSFQAAYTAASCGDVVGIHSGSYASQSISTGSKACGSSASNNVVFTTIPGQPSSACTDNSTASMTDTAVSVAHVTEQCFTAYDNATSGAQCSDISGASGQHTSIIWNVFDHIRFRCSFFDSDHMAVTNSSFGPDAICQHTLEDTIDFRANSTDIDDVTFSHDTFLAQSDGGVYECGTGRHIDEMQGYGVSNFTLEKSTFVGCYGQCLIFRPLNGGVPGPNIKIENNYFDQVENPGQDIDIGNSGTPPDTCVAPILVDYNTFENGGSFHGGCTVTVTVRANIISDSACNSDGFSWDYNVWLATSGGVCGTHTKHCSPTLQNPSSPPNFDIAISDTCAKDAGDPANTPTTDIYDASRPLGVAPDAGANEVH
jgi:hypothetical protein